LNQAWGHSFLKKEGNRPKDETGQERPWKIAVAPRGINSEGCQSWGSCGLRVGIFSGTKEGEGIWIVERQKSGKRETTSKGNNAFGH